MATAAESVMEEPVVRAAAAKHGKTPAQVLLRWGVQHGFVVLPKSVHRESIAENAAIFDLALDRTNMGQLDALEEKLSTGWDPATQA
jgi:diketogulonate reductase-like aldo/keto reductase